MNILQVEFKNRSGYILRGIVTLPNTHGPVPFMVHLHGFGSNCSGYRSMMHIHLVFWQNKALGVLALVFMEMVKVMAIMKM